jgi:hypothetical protein
MRVVNFLAVVAWVLALACPSSARAQPYEAVGLRALGMGGAFVAVADDASAVYWNPAGLATGRFFSFVFDGGRVDSDVEPIGAGPVRAGGRLSGSLLALGTPPLGVSYYRLTSVAARVTPEATGETADLARLRTSHVGVTLVQTLIDGLHLGGTLKYVHGTGASAGPLSAPDDALRAAAALPDDGEGAFDVDLGLMADLGRARAGLAVRNLLEPTFRLAGDREVSVGRQVRAGVAVFPTDTLSLAADADLTTSTDLTGERRSLAFGAEQRVWRERVGVRGGVRLSTIGEARTTLTAGASVAVRTGVYADGYVALGTGRLAASGGGVGVRVIF